MCKWSKSGSRQEPLGARLCTAGRSPRREGRSEERAGAGTGRPGGTCTNNPTTPAARPRHCEQTSENGVLRVFKKKDYKILFHSHTQTPSFDSPRLAFQKSPPWKQQRLSCPLLVFTIVILKDTCIAFMTDLSVFVFFNHSRHAMLLVLGAHVEIKHLN